MFLQPYVDRTSEYLQKEAKPAHLQLSQSVVLDSDLCAAVSLRYVVGYRKCQKRNQNQHLAKRKVIKTFIQLKMHFSSQNQKDAIIWLENLIFISSRVEIRIFSSLISRKCIFCVLVPKMHFFKCCTKKSSQSHIAYLHPSINF